MNFKKLLICFSIFLLIFSFVPNYLVSAYDTEVNLNITSPVAFLMESETETILYEKNAYDKMYPASTTKMMTAILAIENCKLAEIVTVSKQAIMQVPIDYTNANLQVDEELTVKDLLYAFLIPSANDCGYVLAEHIAGSTEKFADMMNLKATELGCKNTHFTNPSGIQDENHYSTAYDLALIGKYAMKNETFREIVSTTSYNLPATNKYETTDRRFVNTNFLIRESQTKYYYKYATGIKTGYTDDSRDCVVASAKKDGVEYIAVILYAGYTENWLKEKFIDCVTLFDYAFDNYTTKTLLKQGQIFDILKVDGATKDTKMLDVVVENDISAFISTSQFNEDFKPDINIKENLKAPISKGDVIGDISFTINDIKYSSNLVAGEDVEKSNIFPTIFKIFLVLCILYFIMRLIRYRNYLKKRRHMNYRKGPVKKKKRY